jgi:hypothetical protein
MAEDQKTYNFKCGITAYQEECTLAQDKQLSAILIKFDLGELQSFKDVKIMHLFTKLVEDDMLYQILDIILIPEYIPDPLAESKWNNLRRSEVVSVFEDFFTLSPALEKWFGIGKFVQVLRAISNTAMPDSISDLQKTIPNTSNT